ncbi:MAG: hotdog fold thioesterase [Solirubrobacteraceae bacterium]
MASSDVTSPWIASAPWLEPVRGGHPTSAMMGLSGIEQLAALRDGTIPQPPLSRLTGMRLEEFGDGNATFTMPLTGWLTDPSGIIPIGPLVIPTDAAMACALMTRLPANSPFTTSQLVLAQLRPVSQGATVSARATVVEAGEKALMAEVSLFDDADGLVARGSSLCVILPATAQGAREPDRPATAAADSSDNGRQASLDPWQRRPPDDGLRALTGLVEISEEPGVVKFALPASPWFAAPPPGRVQGGMVALLADAAISRVIRAAGPEHSTFAPLELKLNFLRPLASDGGQAQACARLVQAGRRIAVAGAEVLDARGRTIAIASGSAIRVS